MDVREAAHTAREYVADLFAYERIGEIFLEEVDFDDRSDVWKSPSALCGRAIERTLIKRFRQPINSLALPG